MSDYITNFRRSEPKPMWSYPLSLVEYEAEIEMLKSRIAELEAENERLQNKLIIVHEKAMEDTSAALFWYAKAKGISLEHTSIESNTIAWMQKRIAELEARIKELYADNEALREHYPHFLSSEQEANYVDGVLKREWNTPEEDEAWEGLLGSSSIEKAVETVKDDPLYGGEG